MWMCFLPHPMLNSLYDGTISRAVLRDVLCVVQMVILFLFSPSICCLEDLAFMYFCTESSRVKKLHNAILTLL